MRKVSIPGLFISVIFLVSSAAYAQTMAPPANDASKNLAVSPVASANELTKPMLLTTSAEAFNKRWSYSADLHGTSSQGVGLLLHSPLFWNYLSLRAGANFDSVRTSSNRLSYGAGVVGLRFNTFVNSSEPLFPYVQLNVNFYFLSDSQRQGNSKTGYELLYGAEWRTRSTGWDGDPIDHSVFIEAGFGDSDTQLSVANGGAYIGDGFVTRLGLRRLF